MSKIALTCQPKTLDMQGRCGARPWIWPRRPWMQKVLWLLLPSTKIHCKHLRLLLDPSICQILPCGLKFQRQLRSSRPCHQRCRPICRSSILGCWSHWLRQRTPWCKHARVLSRPCLCCATSSTSSGLQAVAALLSNLIQMLTLNRWPSRFCTPMQLQEGAGPRGL